MIFAMLGRCETGKKLAFTLHLEYNIVPGTVVNYEVEDADEDYFSMDLPNLVEKWRVDYTTGVGCRPVDVVWKAECSQKLLFEKMGEIQELGWDVSEQEEAVIQFINAEAEYPPVPTTKFKLRRKALVGPLVAAEPSSWSWRSGPDWEGMLEWRNRAEWRTSRDPPEGT